MSWTKSLGAGRVGFDSISRNFTNISEKDCNNKGYSSERGILFPDTLELHPSKNFIHLHASVFIAQHTC